MPVTKRQNVQSLFQTVLKVPCHVVPSIYRLVRNKRQSRTHKPEFLQGYKAIRAKHKNCRWFENAWRLLEYLTIKRGGVTINGYTESILYGTFLFIKVFKHFKISSSILWSVCVLVISLLAFLLSHLSPFLAYLFCFLWIIPSSFAITCMPPSWINRSNQLWNG